jgi:hypothetical protein
MSSYFFEQHDQTVGVGNTFDLVVVLDPAGEAVNAVEGALTFDASKVRYVGGSTARSAVNLWVEDPSIVDGAEGSVPFSGITPGGFGEVLIAPSDGYPNTIMFVARFEALAAGDVQFSIHSPASYLNDGAGTAAATHVVPYSLQIQAEKQQVTGAERDGWAVGDVTPPLSFVPMITQGSDAFGDDRVVIFSTVDKESGIDHYEVSENRGVFVPAVSPHVLQDQDGYVSVRVRAIDHAGNVQEEVLAVGMSPWVIFFGCILVCISVVCVVAAYRRNVWRRNRR